MADHASIDSFAAIVLAHRDTVHLERLVAALPGCDVFVHWDAKSSALTPAQRVGSLGDTRVRYLPRRDVRLASWSLVALELDALRVALEQSRADYIAVISGADYPLVAPAQMIAALELRRGRTWVRNVPLPHDLWNAPMARDGGLWRWRWYFPTRRDHVFMVGSRPVFVPVRRRVPDALNLRASPHWKVYARRDAELLLKVLDEHPELIKRARHIFTPEESFVSSVMASPALFGDQALAVDDDGPSYVSWAGFGGQQHPAWFSRRDLGKLEERRTARVAAGVDELAGPIFGRKFSSEHNGELVAEVRSELWSPTVP